MSDTKEDPTTMNRSESDQNGMTTGRSDIDTNVQIDNVTKIYDEGGEDVVAVEDVSIDIRRGEFLVFVGPSGCGKTTTLRTVAGLEEATEGRIVIDGVDVSGLEPRQRGVAMVFQNYTLSTHMTITESISFPLLIHTHPDYDVVSCVVEVEDLIEI